MDWFAQILVKTVVRLTSLSFSSVPPACTKSVVACCWQAKFGYCICLVLFTWRYQKVENRQNLMVPVEKKIDSLQILFAWAKTM